ncbi:acyltransferase [Patiriisocius marinistellae]|uniref:Acyltransferase n=1 Tax=Patiriisocius marinistellae TaxID=2494560 RepID=A0A5J4G181_9FLAO|nr:1-acyl-sn-glycerol-3-phosphate acyltransferase [Patiriisocius marinistellae]GEQ86276.1 acyltransferase [Patiriisocius marinistellae]
MGVAKFIYHTVFGWKIKGDFDRNIKKSVLIVAPHTSYFDFILSVLARRILKIEINFVGKRELFHPLIGWYFRWMGGAPLNRGKNENKVQAIASVIKSKNEFRLAIAPEGTRTKVETWKTGYYYIAREAGVPIIPISLDYPSKTMTIGTAFFPTGSIVEDEIELRKFFKGVIGKIPEWS